MTREEIIQRIDNAKERGENIYLSKADISRSNLSCLDLTRAHLERANLELAYLANTNLCSAYMFGSNLRAVVLDEANLREATLYGANLEGADLEGTDLHGADLRRTNLKGAYLKDADLYGADLDFSVFPLWCGSLHMHIDERQAKQLLYHVLSLVDYSKHISEDTKKLLLTRELVDYANQFHRVGEVPRLQEIESEDEE